MKHERRCTNINKNGEDSDGDLVSATYKAMRFTMMDATIRPQTIAFDIVLIGRLADNVFGA